MYTCEVILSIDLQLVLYVQIWIYITLSCIYTLKPGLLLLAHIIGEIYQYIVFIVWHI